MNGNCVYIIKQTIHAYKKYIKKKKKHCGMYTIQLCLGDYRLVFHDFEKMLRRIQIFDITFCPCFEEFYLFDIVVM